MKNSFVQVKEVISRVVFQKHKNLLCAQDALKKKESNGNLWVQEVQKQDAIF